LLKELKESILLISIQKHPIFLNLHHQFEV